MLEMLSFGLVMKMIILLLHVHPIKQSSENKHLTELTLHTTHDLTDVEDRSVTMSSVVEMVNRTWWNRTWTIQEVVLAQNPVLVCGFYVIEWDDLVQGCTFSRKHHLTCCALATGNSGGLGSGDFIEGFREPVKHLQNHRMLRHSR
jgi:hypothetical protein